MPSNHKKSTEYTGYGVRALLRGKLAYQALQTEYKILIHKLH